MLAEISGLKEWKDGSGFPMLVIHANHLDHKAELEALEMIEEAVSDIVGNAYGKKIASTQKGSGQNGLMVIDLSAILTMFKAIQENETKKAGANAWITNWLKDKVKPSWLPSVKKEKEKQEEYTCRCGLVFRSKSKKKAKRKWIKHQKRCSVLKELEQTLFKRTSRLEKENGRKSKKQTDKRKVGEAKGHRSRQSADKHKKLDSRTEVRRTKRNNHKTKTRKS